MILRKPASDQVARWAAKALDALELADTMVRDLLDVAKVESGQRLPLALEEADFEALVDAAIENMQTRFGDRFVCAIDVPERGHFAPSHLRRALENLITNAVKYGDPERPIRVSARLKFGRVLLAVHKEGSYILVEQQETLFRAFERSRGGAPATEGWGLGLAQVRGVAEAHGGSVAIDSLQGRGTTFTIDVPLDARPYQDAPAHSTD